jgi:hypothetical protein
MQVRPCLGNSVLMRELTAVAERIRTGGALSVSTDQTCGSRCLVAGAEGIRTAGPLCGSWRLRKARSFSGVTALKPTRELFCERCAGKFGPKKRTNFYFFSKVEKPKRTGGSNPLCSSNESLLIGCPVGISVFCSL